MTAEQATSVPPTHGGTSKAQMPVRGKPGQSSVEQPLLEPLSQRELEVLQLLASGASNQEIATALVVAPGTVKLHVSHILSKLGVNSRTRAIIRARDLGLLAKED
jgi:ATP/maltotriose-dependent transcriptional regulator MalT